MLIVYFMFLESRTPTLCWNVTVSILQHPLRFDFVCVTSLNPRGTLAQISSVPWVYPHYMYVPFDTIRLYWQRISVGNLGSLGDRRYKIRESTNGLRSGSLVNKKMDIFRPTFLHEIRRSAACDICREHKPKHTQSSRNSVASGPILPPSLGSSPKSRITRTRNEISPSITPTDRTTWF